MTSTPNQTRKLRVAREDGRMQQSSLTAQTKARHSLSEKCKRLQRLSAKTLALIALPAQVHIYVWLYIHDTFQYIDDMLCSLQRWWCCVVTPPRAPSSGAYIFVYTFITDVNTYMTSIADCNKHVDTSQLQLLALLAQAHPCIYIHTKIDVDQEMTSLLCSRDLDASHRFVLPA